MTLSDFFWKVEGQQLINVKMLADFFKSMRVNPLGEGWSWMGVSIMLWLLSVDVIMKVGHHERLRRRTFDRLKHGN